MKKQTLINGRPVWFTVCADNDCHAKLFGPYFNREDAENESNVGCEFAHFVIPQVVDWMTVTLLQLPIEMGVTTGEWKEILDWTHEHSENAENHPMYSHQSDDEDYYCAINHCGSREPRGSITCDEDMHGCLQTL